MSDGEFSSSVYATKAYVDAVAVGLIDPKASCRAATTANITLSAPQTIDGVSVIAGDRVLVKNQSTGSQNGIYVCAAGAWTRATDADTSAEVTTGLFTFIEEGSSNGDTGWVLTTDNPITLGTTALTFVKFTSLGGDFVGPASSTDNAVVRFDGTGGKTGQNSGVTIDDNNRLELPANASGGMAFYNAAGADRILLNAVGNVFSFKTEANGGSNRSLVVGSGVATGITFGANSILTYATSTSSQAQAAHDFTNGGVSFSATSGAQYFMRGVGTVNQASGTASFDYLFLNPTFTAVGSGGANFLRCTDNATDMFKVDRFGKLTLSTTLTAGGTTGNQTIDKPTGTVNIAADGTTVTVTDERCTTSSYVFAVLRTNDATATIKNVVPGAGSFVINLGAAATGEVSIAFWVIN